MRTSIATLTVAVLFLVLGAAAAQAAPSEVNVRIEGGGETLFEGPILTEGHDVGSSSGTKEDTEEHTCDGTNNKAHTTPGPTPTATAADAMSIIGETFSGKWYPGFDDYLITRWGPEKEEDGMSWGIVVNNVYTNTGGCQYELSTDDEVLWVYNAFAEEPILALLPASPAYVSGARPLTAKAELNKPFAVEVLAYHDKKGDEPPATPERAGSEPYPDADVSPVKTSAAGFEKLETESAETVTTDAEGKASIVFTEPGWHRIKAGAVGEGEEEDAIRSNRLDVCVPAEGESGCGEAPAEDQTRTASLTEEERKLEEQHKREEEVRQSEEEAERHEEEVKLGEEMKQHEEEVKREEEAKQRGEEGKSEVLTFKVASTGDSGDPIASLARVQTPTLDGQGAAQGKVGVSWRILEPGVGSDSWAIASKTLGPANAGYVTRATGSAATSALLALPAGAAYELQITFTDALGSTSTMQIGKALVPLDDRWSGLDYRGHWRKARQSSAWLGTINRGSIGAQVAARLGAGRAVFLLRGTSSGAKVEVLAGSRREVLTVARGSGSSQRLITSASRSRAGTVVLRVLAGTVDLDGVAVEP
jgi:hypothetical protein